jgi:hypothetical protein
VTGAKQVASTPGVCAAQAKSGKKAAKVGWAKADRNTMVLVDSDSDNCDSGDEENTLELEENAHGAAAHRIRTTSEDDEYSQARGNGYPH